MTLIEDPVVLNSEQLNHFARLLDIYSFWRSAYDYSERGAGKTIIALKLAEYFKLPIFLVCENQSTVQWEREAARIGVKFVKVLSYEALRGSSVNNPRHGYLTRIDQNGVSFQYTEKFQTLAQQGILLVLDESHRARTPDNQTFLSCRELTRGIYDNKSPSKVLLCSATPGVEVRNIYYLVALLGIVRDNDLFTNEKGRALKITGLHQLRDWIIQYNPNLTISLKRNLKMGPNTANINRIVTDLYNESIVPMLSSSIISKLPFDNLVENSFIPIIHQQDEFDKTIDQMKKHKSDTCLLQKLEKLKAPSVAAFVRSLIQEDPQTKVIVYCHYNEAEELILKELEGEYPSVMINGQTENQKRHQLYKQFNQPNLDLQIMITHPAVSGTSLNLDDQDGRFRRVIVALASYHYIAEYQSLGRICRVTTKSQPKCYIIFGNNGSEINIMMAQSQKGNFMSQIAPGRHDTCNRRTVHYSAPGVQYVKA